jgi:outer membrane protein
MKLLLLTILFAHNLNLFAQDSLSLHQCIEALKKNTLLYTTENRMLGQSDLNIKYNKWSLLPSLNFNMSVNSAFGRRIDPFTNTFSTNTVNSQAFGLNTSIPVFNGGNYFYLRNKLFLEKQKYLVDKNQKINSNKIKIFELFIELCKLQMQKDLSLIRIEKYKYVQSIQKSLLFEGKINSLDTLRSFNSFLTEQSNLFQLNNQINQKTIELNLLIGLPLLKNHLYKYQSIKNCSEEFKITEDYFLENLRIQKEILAEQLGVEKALILPSISIIGSIGTGYSTFNKDYMVSGNPTIPFDEQINKNLNEGVGINLSVPIFNRGSYLRAKQLAELNRAELEELERLKEFEKEKRILQYKSQQYYLELEIIQLKIIASNVEVIFEKTLQIYKEGKISYREVELAFLDWQSKVIDFKLKELDNEALKCFLN